MKLLPTLAAGAVAAFAGLATAGAASANCGCAPRHVHHLAYRQPVRHAAERVVYVPVPGPERVVREPVYVPGPERVVREPVFVPGPTRVVREPVYAPPVVVREHGWRPSPVFASPVRYGWRKGFHERDGFRDHEGWRDRDGWRDHDRFDHDRFDRDERFGEHRREWR